MSLPLFASILLATSALDVPIHELTPNEDFSNLISNLNAKLTEQQNLANENSEFSGLPQLKPPRGQLPPTFWERHQVLVRTGTGCLLAGVAGLVWYIRRSLPAPVIPPALQAQRQIEAASQETDSGLVLSQLSRILRRYVAMTFGLPNGEMTTNEFISAAYACNDIGPSLAERLAVFLRACDERKFSPNPPETAADPITEALKLVAEGEQRQLALKQATEAKAS